MPLSFLVFTPAPLIGAGERSLFYAEMTTSPAETCGAEPPRCGRFSRIRRGAVRFVCSYLVVVDTDRNRAVGGTDEVEAP
jgi:hypothetical protein